MMLMMLLSDVFVRLIHVSLVVVAPLATRTTALFIPSSSSLRQTSFQKCWQRTTNTEHLLRRRRAAAIPLYVKSGSGESDDAMLSEGSPSIWNPSLRKGMGGVAAFGALETMYLTYSDVYSRGDGQLPNQLLFCSSTSTSVDGSLCSTVLSGPYAHIPGTEIPIAAVGAIAYLLVFGLAVIPLLPPTSYAQGSLARKDDDSMNRVLLLATTTMMGVFSAFLMAILFNVLHQTCGYCIASAICSIGLMSMAWFGKTLPNELKNEGLSISLGGGVVSILAALVLFVTNAPSIDISSNVNAATNAASTTSTLLATTNFLKSKSPSILLAQEPSLLVDQVPPDISTESSPTALQLAADLQKLDARFYGAYWCSHCYDQKQAFGKQAMQRIPYVECSREGKNEQAGLCKEKKIPGYPTWEISGTLYPGEKGLDEIREIVVRSVVKTAN